MYTCQMLESLLHVTIYLNHRTYSSLVWDPSLHDYHSEWDMHGASVISTKFRILPSDFFPLLFSVDILPVLQLLQVFSFEALPALSTAHLFHNATSLSFHPALPLSTITVTVCHLEALLAHSSFVLQFVAAIRWLSPSLGYLCNN
jgi:hypothetical protein